MGMLFIEPPEWMPLLPRPGTFKHPSYGEINISRERNARFAANIKDGVYQTRIPVDAEHDVKASGALGWIVDAKQNTDGSVDGKVEWNDRGKTLLKDNRFAYVSPEWYDRWLEPGSGTEYHDVLIAAALCRNPFFKESDLRSLIATEQGLFPLHIRLSTEEGATDMADQGTTKTTQTTEPTPAQQFAELQEAVRARDAEIAALRQTSETQTTALTQATERIQAMETDARRKRFTAFAAGDKVNPRWFGEVAKHVSLLEALADTFGEDSDQFKLYTQQQKAMAEQIAQSALFREIGSDASGTGPNAWGKIEAKAKALREQDKGLTQEQAINRVLADEPQLYNEYRAEQVA